MKEIRLSNGEIALVSDEDYDFLNQWSWSKNSKHVVRGTSSNYVQECITMHQEVAQRMGMQDVGEIDHKDRNRLNNQRENLRPATRSQNQANAGLRKDSTSSFKGVSFHVRLNKWQARLQRGKTRLHLGYFSTPEKAAQAYDRAARRHFGEFARTNF